MTWKPNPKHTLTAPNGVRVSYVEITPEHAATLLEKNTHNRNQRDRLINQYARDLDRKDWPFTGDAIRVATDGTLLDGQHRLEAICASEKSMPTLLVEGLDSSVQRYIDGGAKRTAADQLRLLNVPNSSIVSSVSRLYLRWGAWRENQGDVYVSNAEIVDYTLSDLDHINQAAMVGHAIQRHIPGVSQQALGTAYYRALKVTGDVFKVAHFFHKVDTGEELKLGDPIYALRNSLIRRDYPSIVQLWMTVRAWNATLKDEPLGKNIYLPRDGITTKGFPDMKPFPVETPLTELDEEVAEAQQRLRERKKA